MKGSRAITKPPTYNFVNVYSMSRFVDSVTGHCFKLGIRYHTTNQNSGNILHPYAELVL